MNLYRWLLKLYPAHFREEYGVPMEQQFRDDYRDAETLSQRFALWLSVIWDVATSAPRQLGHEIFLDLKHAVRLYLKRWAATGLAIVALGLAIGVNTGVFSVLNALLLRGLPFAKPAQLTELWGASVSAFQGHNAVKQWAAVSAYLQDATTFSSSEMNLTRERDAYRVNATETSSNFFKLLGVEPAVGRTFGTDEDITGHNAVAVISFSLWQQLYGGNPAIRGTLIHVNGAPFTIIGVAPANFDYPKKTSVWMPTVFDFETIPKRGAFLFETVGRLKEGVTLAVARGLFEAEVQRANPAQFKRVMAAEEQNRPHMTSLQDQLAGPVRQASWVLAGLSLLVLLIACTNVAQLLLSRTAERREELELRAALGASRARLFQQLTTEAACLTVSGAALGLLVAHWTALLASSVAPAPLATQEYSVLDWPVLLFTAVLAILTGVFFGVLPAWLTGRLQAAGQIARSVHRGTKRVRAGFVVLQTAFALCLVTCSFVMGRTFLDLLQADLGFQPANVVTLNVSVQGTRHTGAGEWSYYSEALARLRALPGVTAAGAVGHLPLGHGVYMANTFKLDSGQDTGHTVVNAVTPGYFRAIGTKFLAGGDFAENAGHQPLVIVNEAFAKGTGLGNGIVGRRVIAPWGGPPYRVTGVVSTERFGGPAYPGEPEVYWQIEEEPPAALTLVARVTGDAQAYALRCRDSVRAIDASVPIYDVAPLEQRLDEALARPRFYTTATLFLGSLALLLAAIGSYGTLSYSIAQRTHEMGVRMAVGASSWLLRRMLLREGLLPILAGIAVGVILSLASIQLLQHLTENKTAALPAVWAAFWGAAVLSLTGVIAVWNASDQILSINPTDALRSE